MKTIKGKFRITATVMLVIFMSAYVLAQKPGVNRSQKSGIVPDLTEEQKEKMSELRSAHIQSMTQLKAETMVLRAELDQLSVEKNPSLDKINAKIDELAARRADMEKARATHRMEIRSLLTEEQRIIFDARTSNKRFKGKQHGYRQNLAYGPKRTSCPYRGQGNYNNSSQKQFRNK